MIEPETALSRHRATILVGYGGFGLEVLRRLLASTAPRGVLTWEEPRGGAGPSERHLQDLALLWFPDPLVGAEEQARNENAGEGSSLDMMRDLYRQIQQIGGEAPSEVSFADALAEAADTLLSASGRSSRTGSLPLGLDVIVLARPTSGEVLGTLDRVLIRAMDRLANNASLQRAVQGAGALNFLAIFDFENYWDRSEHGRTVRRALYDSVEEWERRRINAKPAFGRFYLVDGRTEDGVRESFHRIDEISLLLEFLLFEGQRGGELPRLYHPVGPHESPVATFGIRLIERSAGLLAHLAAARFGIDWLEYLAGIGLHRGNAEAVHVRKRLEPFGPKELDRLLDAGALRRDVEIALSTLERELTQRLPIGMPEWPERVRTRYDETVRALEVQISEKTNESIGKVTETHLAPLPKKLRAGIHADLHDETDPVPVGGVIAELENLVHSLEQIPEVIPPRPEDKEDLLNGIAKLHGDYDQFDAQRVDVEGLRTWWPLLGLALATGLTPLVHQLLGEIPKPDPLRFLLTRGYAALQWLNNPLAIGALLFAGTWAIGSLLFQGSIAARVDRTRRYYKHPDQGRFVDRLRRGLRAGGALREPVDYLLDRLLYDMALSIRGDVTREIGRVLGRLKDRRREILWLRDQLRGFLGLHGFKGENLSPAPGKLHRNDTGIRYALERAEDFELMLRSNPAIPVRFRSTQTSQAPFAGWDERYSRAFLVPLEFLDRLSQSYEDPFQRELAQPGTGPEQERMAREILKILEQHGRFGLAFRFDQQEGLPPDQRFCLLPALWQRLKGVPAALSDLRMTDRSVLTSEDAGRGYLLRLQAGIAPKCLVETL
ncbi:MAG TPA: hypothetical protein VGQ76_14180 [Thermoanaerobaculia bacterium]|jgi:hypothetical protein|nr:hypothetical protein [Thermoanaerobaculia bacterium]